MKTEQLQGPGRRRKQQQCPQVGGQHAQAPQSQSTSERRGRLPESALGARTHGAAVGRRLGRDAGERGRAARVDLVDRAAQLDQLPPRPALDAVPPAGALRTHARGSGSPIAAQGGAFAHDSRKRRAGRGQTRKQGLSFTTCFSAICRIAANTTVLNRSTDLGSHSRPLDTCSRVRRPDSLASDVRIGKQFISRTQAPTP